MKRKIIFLMIIMIITTILVGCKQEEAGSTDIGNGIRVMSYNITVNDPDHKWENRRDYILTDINNTQPDIIGFQEVSSKQYKWLKKKLKGYASIITYRDNQTVSEACPVFYSTSKFMIIKSDTFWLSETPKVMSKDWDAACYRICTYVMLEKLSDGQRFTFYNTHLDHVSELARINGIKTILNKIEQNKDLFCIITGDFNANVKSQTYQIATNKLTDTCIAALDSKDGATFQNWGQNLDRLRIDYIFVLGDFMVNKFKIVDNTYNGEYASDHFAIYAEVDVSFDIS